MNVELDELLKRMAAAKAALAEVDSEGLYTPSVPGPPASRDALDALRRRLPDLPDDDFEAFMLGMIAGNWEAVDMAREESDVQA